MISGDSSLTSKMWSTNSRLGKPWFFSFSRAEEIERREGIPDGAELTVLLHKYELQDKKVRIESLLCVAKVLEKAHKNGEIHGNLDEHDIFLDTSGVIGLSFSHQSHANSRRPEEGKFRRATDIYGLGVMLLNLLSPDSTGYPSKVLCREPLRGLT